MNKYAGDTFLVVNAKHNKIFQSTNRNNKRLDFRI